MHLKTRDLVYIGVFGALWGATEMSLGSALHTLNVPFSGVVLAGIGLTVAFVGRLFVPRAGSVLLIGLVTAFLKVFSMGGVVLNPMLGIVVEALLAELVLATLGPPHRLSFVAAGGLAILWTFVQPFFTFGILGGQGLATVMGWTLSKGAAALNLAPSSGLLLILAPLVAGHLLVGCLAGVLAWDVGRIVQRRLQPTARI